jgi:hypothetical protein
MNFDGLGSVAAIVELSIGRESEFSKNIPRTKVLSCAL